MPLQLQLIRASEFIRLNAAGHFDLETSRLALAGIARACRKRGIERAMLDLRGFYLQSKPIFTPRDLAALVDTFHQFGFTKNLRLALLYIQDPHGRARMFSFISLIHGWQVRGFDSFESAILWLSDEPVNPATLLAGERSIPIRHPGISKQGASSRRSRTRSFENRRHVLKSEKRI